MLRGAAIVGGDGRVAGGLDRKAREVLTILALRAPAGVGLDELQRLLWDEPPPSAAKIVRAHVSRLRSALRAAGVDGSIERLGHDHYRLVLPAGSLDLDVVAAARERAREALGEGRADAAAVELAEARAHWNGEPELPATIAAQALAQAWQQERGQLTVEHLAALAEGSQPGRALGELELLTSSDPLAEPLWAHRVRALTRCGRQADALRAAAEARRILVEVGLEPGPELRTAEAEALAAGRAGPIGEPPPDSAPAAAPPSAVAVRYAGGARGHTAYTTFGDGHDDRDRPGRAGRDLVVANPAMITIDGLLDEPHLAAAIGRLGRDARVTCLDRRGIGLSDPLEPGGDLLETWVGDLAAVLDAIGAERPTVLANFDTGLAALELAARHPDRVGALVLVHCFARFTRGDGYPYGIDLSTADTVVDDSVATQPGSRQADTLGFVAPSVATDPAFRAWWDRIGQRAASPSTAAAILKAGARIDVRHRLPEVAAPTLLLHRRSCLGVDIGHARYLQEHLPRARLEVLTGTDSLWFTDHDDLLEAVARFVAER